MILFESFLYEQFPFQQPQPGYVPDQNAQSAMQGEAPPEQAEPAVEENPELIPIKKLILIKKLKDLKSALENYNITGYSQELETVLNFSENLSYETLKSILEKILETLMKKSGQENRNGHST